MAPNRIRLKRLTCSNPVLETRFSTSDLSTDMENPASMIARSQRLVLDFNLSVLYNSKMKNFENTPKP
jgi:hypothetical protein